MNLATFSVTGKPIQACGMENSSCSAGIVTIRDVEKYLRAQQHHHQVHHVG